jgi:hypothetical protein
MRVTYVLILAAVACAPQPGARSVAPTPEAPPASKPGRAGALDTCTRLDASTIVRDVVAWYRARLLHGTALEMFRAFAILVLAVGCDLGAVETGGGQGPDAGGGGGGGGGGGSLDAGGGGGGDGTATLQVTVTTTPRGGTYAPQNVVAIWIENQAGTFVKTIGRWANVRREHLVAWTQKAGPADADAVSGATRLNHTASLTLSWNLQDRQNALVPDGTYTVRMELADQNSTTAGQNHQGTFTFVKGGEPQIQTGLTNGGFTNVSLTFTP